MSADQPQAGRLFAGMISVVAVLGIGGLVYSATGLGDDDPQSPPTTEQTAEHQEGPISGMSTTATTTRPIETYMDRIWSAVCASPLPDGDLLDSAMDRVDAMKLPDVTLGRVLEATFATRACADQELAFDEEALTVTWSPPDDYQPTTTMTAPPSPGPAPRPTTPAPTTSPPTTTPPPPPPAAGAPPEGWTCGHVYREYGRARAERGDPYYSADRDDDGDGISCEAYP